MVERQSPELSLEPDKIGERAVKIHLSTWYEKMKQDGSASRLRFEKYKSATTLREVKHKGGTWKDMLWDFSRGYFDFRLSSGASRTV